MDCSNLKYLNLRDVTPSRGWNLEIDTDIIPEIIRFKELTSRIKLTYIVDMDEIKQLAQHLPRLTSFAAVISDINSLEDAEKTIFAIFSMFPGLKCGSFACGECGLL